MNRARTQPNWFMANIETLEVIKMKPNQLKAEAMAKDGYVFTTKAAYQRFKNGTFTAATFREVEYPKNSGQMIRANVNYTN